MNSRPRRPVNGVLLLDKKGTIIGSVGVSGGSVDEDEDVANAGAAALLR